MGEIRLWNTRTKDKVPLRPDASGRVGMYVCGPTVYDRAHVGNARPVVAFDVLFRLLRREFGSQNVTYVRNFTDVDDKIIARAAETGRAIADLTAETTRWYLEDMAALGALEPTHMPRATDYVNNPSQPVDMVRMITDLVATGHGYEAAGHVLFAVASWPAYGSLSGRTVEDMIAGARVEVAPYKRDPMDFVLWKPSAPEQPGWDSPWGRGRPGWHIECSAMAKAILGPRFQIHGGGIDLVFPHHENERAQSCCANHTDEMAEIWMHNGYLTVDGEKMSKSLGNVFTVKDLIDRGIPGPVIRHVLLSTHYRQPLDWTARRVEESEAVLHRWRRAIDCMTALGVDAAGDADGSDADSADSAAGEVAAALEGDLNTPAALQAVDVMARGLLDSATPARATLARQVRAGLRLLGFGTLDGALETVARQKGVLSASIAERIEALLGDRLAARRARDFARADAIRHALTAAGVIVKDMPEKAEWELGPDFDPAGLARLEAPR